MITCDLNCDMGEGAGNDAALMPFISSANIACGFHAGDPATMRRTVALAKTHGVAIGAHPSFPDRENFGRAEMQCSAQQVYEWTKEQIALLNEVAVQEGVSLHHVKPHGALYNMAARDASLAAAIARAISDTDRGLILYGLSGSQLISEGKAAGLKTASEVFADRTYQNDGSLTPRKLPNALIATVEAAIGQALQMVLHKEVVPVNGKAISLAAETICIHGDGMHAVAFAKQINHSFQQHHIVIKAL